MTHNDIEGALDAFVQERVSDRLDHLDLQQEVEDAMDNYDWRSAVEGVTDDLDLASGDSVEELEESIGRIRERQEEAAQARDAHSQSVAKRLAHLDARLDAHASTLDDQAVQADRLAERIGERLEVRLATLEAVMIGQVADSDPGEVEELREMLDAAHAERQAQEHQALTDGLADAEARTLERATWYAAVQARAQEHQAQPDRLAEAIDAQRQALDRVCDLVGDRCGGERIICARHHAADALQALLDIHQAQQQEGQA